MVKRVSFRIRRRYFDLIVKGEKKEEIRTDKPYWRKMLLGEHPPEIAIFVCGKEVHRRWIRGKPYLADPEKVLGRPLSEQGIKDVLTNPAIITPLGEQAIPMTSTFGGDFRGGPKTIIVGWTRPSEVAEHKSLVKEIKEATGEAHYDEKQYRADLEAEREE